MVEQRTNLIAKIHIAKKELGLDDGTYRSIIKQACGKESCSKCTHIQLGKVIDLMKDKGWKSSKPKKSYRKAPSELIKKIYALWGELQKIGEVKSKDKTSLDSFVEKHTGISSVQFIGNQEANKIIEILKKWIARCDG